MVRNTREIGKTDKGTVKVSKLGKMELDIKECGPKTRCMVKLVGNVSHQNSIPFFFFVSGRGEFVWPDGTRFQGIWEHGKCDEGTYTFALKTATLQGRWIPKITREKLVEAYYEREAKSKMKAKVDQKGAKNVADLGQEKSTAITKDDTSLLPHSSSKHNSVNKKVKEAEDVKKNDASNNNIQDDEPRTNEPNDSPAILRNKNLLRQQSEVPQESPGVRKKQWQGASPDSIKKKGSQMSTPVNTSTNSATTSTPNSPPLTTSAGSPTNSNETGSKNN